MRLDTPKPIIFGATNLGPYHLARYSTLVESGVDLTVVQTPVAEFYRPWRFDKEKARFHVDQPYEVLNGDKRWRPLLKVTEDYLKSKQPSVVITTGYNSRFNWAAAVVCKRLGIPSIIYLVGWEHERKRQVWKELMKRLYCQRYIDAAIVTGVRAEAYAK
ncbi:MAG: glycosyltransferase, partial [Anaerolineales bacterium]|nr:glycosyltransferase [Anaerolineales bacterium]